MTKITSELQKLQEKCWSVDICFPSSCLYVKSKAKNVNFDVSEIEDKVLKLRVIKKVEERKEVNEYIVNVDNITHIGCSLD